MPKETFILSFESTQNKQQFDHKINCIHVEERGGGNYGD